MKIAMIAHTSASAIKIMRSLIAAASCAGILKF